MTDPEQPRRVTYRCNQCGSEAHPCGCTRAYKSLAVVLYCIGAFWAVVLTCIALQVLTFTCPEMGTPETGERTITHNTTAMPATEEVIPHCRVQKR